MYALMCSTPTGLGFAHDVSCRCLPYDVEGIHDGQVSAEQRPPRTDAALLQLFRKYIFSRRAQLCELNTSSITPIFQILCSEHARSDTLYPLKVFLHSAYQHLTARPTSEELITSTQTPGQESPGKSGGQDAQQSKGFESGNTPTDRSAPPTSTNLDTEPIRRDSDEEPPDDMRRFFRSFNPFSQPKSVREINEAIKAELLRPHPVVEGFIYGFSHPDITSVRLGTGPLIELELIKIGRSDNVGRRMHQWRKQCKYIPRLVFAHAMTHHRRIERIIHQQLHNARLREHLGCSGCGARHTEWFRIDAVYAQSLVVMWQGFTEQQPCDESGSMLPDWLEKIEQIDLDDHDCWISFTCGPTTRLVGVSAGSGEHFQTRGHR